MPYAANSISIKGKDRSESEVRFNCLSYQDFDGVASIGAAAVNTTVQGIPLVLPLRTKILKVAVSYTAIGTGTHKFNIVMGTTAELGTVPQKTQDGLSISVANGNLGAAGQSVFAADQTLGLANVGQIFVPDVTDGYWEAGSVLTLRVVTPASTGSLTNFKVVLLVSPYDPFLGDGGAASGVDY